MEKETALKIAKVLLTVATDFWKFSGANAFDYDYWYGISPEWDVNIFWCDVDNQMEATLYPVDSEGNTKVCFADADMIFPIDKS